jgi:hypothetical protein
LADRIASWMLKGPLTVFILALCTFQLATWIPHLLTWPFFVDHDVFSTLAFGWECGLHPYRELRGDNFPGTIYQFWAVGKVFGWGRTAPAFAMDAALVVAFGAAMLSWSRRRFGRFLPGAIGYASFLSYYLSLDYRNVIQRDWHGPLFMMLGLMIADGWPTRGGRVAAAFCAAAAFVIRPQAVLLAPALAFRIARGDDRAGTPWSPRQAASTTAAWVLLAAALTALGFLPVWLDGTWSDFLGCVRAVAYGGSYNQFTPWRMLRVMINQCVEWHYLVIPVSIMLIASGSGVGPGALIVTWLMALAGAWFYKPMSPVPWPYLTHPYVIVLALNVAILVQALLEAGLARPSLRLGAILLAILASGVVARPKYCGVGESRRAIAALAQGRLPEEAPPGYIEPGSDPGVASYPWRDYRAVLSYLRSGTSPRARIANILRDGPALTGPAARLPAFPAESIAWLAVRPGDEPDFLAALENAGEETLVVWAPAEEKLDPGLRLAAAVRHLAPAVRRHYEPLARFGEIEVWRRKGAGGPAHAEAGPAWRGGHSTSGD